MTRMTSNVQRCHFSNYIVTKLKNVWNEIIHRTELFHVLHTFGMRWISIYVRLKILKSSFTQYPSATDGAINRFQQNWIWCSHTQFCRPIFMNTSLTKSCVNSDSSPTFRRSSLSISVVIKSQQTTRVFETLGIDPQQSQAIAQGDYYFQLPRKLPVCFDFRLV